MAEQQVFATKGNLILYKKALKLAALGYELLDRKRNILIRELISPWVLLHLMQIVSLLKQALR